MKLSEGKLFTIEALNRIEGFEWPEWANYAFMNNSEMFVTFTSIAPHIVAGEEHGFYDGDEAEYIGTGRSHSDWRNSLITRAEFESVGGWVRHFGKSMPEQANEKRIDYTMRSGHQWDYCTANNLNWESSSHADDIIKWRYSKTLAGTAGVAPTHNIESLISQHKAARISTLEARRQLDAAEAAERELMRDIEVWAESQGFDIRLLDESEEKQELVITDRRYLRVDVIECIKPEGGAIKSGDFGVAGGLADRFVIANFDK